jgi:tetratricopeptide (TPR) repeat protein
MPAPDHVPHSVSNAGSDTTRGEGPQVTQTAIPPTATKRYAFGDEIARGGMGVVYRATDTVLDREVAVKVLGERFEPGSAAAHRFLDEARIAGQLQHPGIPAVHDLGELPDGRPFLAMRLVKGKTLADLLARPGAAAGERGRFVAVFEQICQAIGYAHARQVIHRDLKPGNVMVGAFGEVQVMDWGLAKVLSPRRGPERLESEYPTLGTEIRSQRGSDGSLTLAGSVLGTPAFMPPEQAIGAVDQIDARSDVFGLGAILAVILTGQPPFVGDTPEAARQAAAKGKVADAFGRLDACGAGPELVALCKRCLAAEKDGRPADGGAVATAVAELRAAADERARRAELDRVRAEGERAKAEAETREQRKRRRAQLALAAAVGLLLLVGGAFAWRQAEQGRAVRERFGRNAEAVAGLLDQCEAALRGNDAAKAAVALEAAQRRADEGGADELAGRLRRCGEDLEALGKLDEADQFRWAPVESKWPEAAVVAARYREVLGRFGADPDRAGAEVAAARVSASSVRDRLVAALDRALAVEKSAGVRATLAAADPGPFRDAVRDAVQAGDEAALARLADRPAALVQPPGFAAFLGGSRAIRLERRRAILVAAARRQPRDLGLLMALGGTYPRNQLAGAEERVRWYQAAVAVAPANPVAHNGLGIALLDKNDREGAIAEYRESIRLDGNYAPAHNNLGWALHQAGDLEGAIAAYRESIRVNPKIAQAQHNLGWALEQHGDLEGATAAYRESLRLDGKSAPAHNNLGWALEQRGDLEGAIAEYREALRLDENQVYARANLPRAERMRELLPRLPDVLAGRAVPRAPAEGCEFARLCAQPYQNRFAASARLYAASFAADPNLAEDLVAGRRYDAACSAARAARGDGVDAPTDPGQRAGLRAKALAWLRADLALRRKQAASSSAAERQAGVAKLAHWLVDTDLSGVRPGPARVGMPDAERTDWDKFWAEVRATRAEARKPPPREVKAK